ncbi:MAG: molybdenum cofactor guanylyltransferase [Desulfocapsaceae bacterium]|nr:molybdenum cofactor guanylyltransferase [Desulfocapsaceae bacterium]
MAEAPFSLLQSASIPVLEICGATRAARRERIVSLGRDLGACGLQVTAICQTRQDERAEDGGRLWGSRYRILGGPHASVLPCDLILTEGGAGLQPTATIRLDREPAQAAGDLGTLSAGSDGDEVRDGVLAWLSRIWLQTPVWACVLIGGRSSRMGRAKHLLKDGLGRTWLARTVELLRPLVHGVVVAGRGEIPEDAGEMIRLADVPGAAGPLAGILAALRWFPAVSWLVVACDMPDITEDALRWLLSTRRPGIWGTLPRLQEEGYLEPLLAHYDFRCAPLFEQLLHTGELRIVMVAENRQIATPLVPVELRLSWRNVNTVEGLEEKGPAGTV